MRVLICGSREWTDRDAIKKEVLRLKPSVIIEGGARGADTLAREVGVELGILVRTFLADWKTYGRAAGPIRNTRMLVEGKPDLVLAFHKYLAESKGTQNMVKQAKKAGVKTIVRGGTHETS